jgi:hypothetical protein
MSRMYLPGLVYDEPAPYDGWLKYVIFGLPLLLVIIGIVLIKVDLEGTFAMIGDAALVGAIFYFVMPRRFQIFEDRIKIVLARPFSISIPFSTIKELHPGSGYLYGGIKFATSARNVVEITRHRGMDIIISPANRDMFLGQYRLAKQAYDNSKIKSQNSKP